MNKKIKTKYRGAYVIKVPDKHIGAKMMFPISISKNPFAIGADHRINITIDSHPRADRQIKEIIVIFEEKR